MKPITYMRLGGPRDGEQITLLKRAHGGFNEVIDGVFHYYVAYGKELVLEYRMTDYDDVHYYNLTTAKHQTWKRRVCRLLQPIIEGALYGAIVRQIIKSN